MTERGRITKLEGRRATISCGSSACSDECFGCHNAGGIREYQAWNAAGLELAAGDGVEVGTRGTAAAGLLLLVLPLALLFASYAAAAIAAPGAGQGLHVLVALGGFGLGVVGAVLAKRRMGPADMPVILRRLAPEESALDNARSAEGALEHDHFAP